MSEGDDDTSAKVKATLDAIEAGEPLLRFFIDEPLAIRITPEGALLLDFFWTTVEGAMSAAKAHALLTPAVTARLKAVLQDSQNVLGASPEAPTPRSVQ
jgi:hypothetical protein